MPARNPPIGAPPSPSSVTSRLVRPTLRRFRVVMVSPPLPDSIVPIAAFNAVADNGAHEVLHERLVDFAGAVDARSACCGRDDTHRVPGRFPAVRRGQERPA